MKPALVNESEVTPDGVLLAPFGSLALYVSDDRLARIEFGRLRRAVRPKSPVARRAADALESYLDNPDTLSCDWFPLTGTDFQRRVWRHLASIPRGKAQTYGAVAEKLGTGPRAVGNACRNNPYPLLVPCHRVVSATGPGGYSGALDGHIHRIKRWLLRHEGLEF